MFLVSVQMFLFIVIATVTPEKPESMAKNYCDFMHNQLAISQSAVIVKGTLVYQASLLSVRSLHV